MLVYMKSDKKPKLNLTVSTDKRQLAARLATHHNRSVSNLFEFLIEKEWQRVRRVSPSTKAPSSSG